MFPFYVFAGIIGPMKEIPFCRCVSKFFAMPLAAWVILLVGAGALIMALMAQYVFDVQACELCWWQRGPYALAIVFGAMALLSCSHERRARLFLWLAALTFLVSMGLGIYHTGVEQHWWEDAVACAITPLDSNNIADMSLNDMRDRLLATVGVPCDEITWSFLGLSMANWNVFFSFGMLVFAALAASGCVREGKPCGCCCSCKGDGSQG
jgi:disulfide bond formation protein DsbB